MPSAPPFELFLGVWIVQFAFVVPIAWQIFLEPLPEVAPERFVFFAELEIHR